MATVTVRVVTRSGRRGVEAGPHGVVVRVAAAPEHGRATEEARRLLADRLGVPPSRVGLRTGTRSRTKVFEVDGLPQSEAEARLFTA